MRGAAPGRWRTSAACAARWSCSASRRTTPSTSPPPVPTTPSRSCTSADLLLLLPDRCGKRTLIPGGDSPRRRRGTENGEDKPRMTADARRSGNRSRSSIWIYLKFICGSSASLRCAVCLRRELPADWQRRRVTVMLIAPMNPKQRAADAALEFISSDMVVGLGNWLDRRLLPHRPGTSADGTGGCTTSAACRHQSALRAAGTIELGIPLTTLAEHPHPDVTVDGADEVAPQPRPDQRTWRGAAAREDRGAGTPAAGHHRRCEQNRAGAGHQAARCPSRSRPSATKRTARSFDSLGCEPLLRRKPDGNAVRDGQRPTTSTIAGFPHIDDPSELDRALTEPGGNRRVGTVPGIAQSR